MATPRYPVARTTPDPNASAPGALSYGYQRTPSYSSTENAFAEQQLRQAGPGLYDPNASWVGSYSPNGPAIDYGSAGVAGGNLYAQQRQAGSRLSYQEYLQQLAEGGWYDPATNQLTDKYYDWAYYQRYGRPRPVTTGNPSTADMYGMGQI